MGNANTERKKRRKRRKQSKLSMVPGEDFDVCEVCNTALSKPGGYADTGMCGPCCTGEAATLSEFGDTW